MNILIINHYAGSREMGMEFRPYYFAAEWLKMGYHPVILSASYSHLRRRNPTVRRNLEKESVDQVDYLWIKTCQYKKNGIKRAFSMLEFIAKAWRRAEKIVKLVNPDVVVTSSTYPLDTFVGQRIKKKSAKDVVLIHEVHDMWPSTLKEIGGMSKWHPFVVIMQLAENSAYRKSDKVVSLLPYAKEYMVEHGMSPDKFSVIPNGIVLDEWINPEPLPDTHRDLLDRIKKKGKIIGYFGGHAISNALEVLLAVAEKMQNEKVYFVLVGNGSEKGNLEEQARRKGLKNIFFLDSVSKSSIPTLCEWFDIVYMGTKDSPLYRFGLSLNKMFDSMMTGKPIICAITSPETPLSKYGCGFMVDSMDVDGIIEAIHKIEKMSDSALKEMGEKSKCVARENYSYHVLAKNFACLFEGQNHEL